jgi:UDP-GlcNAc:undecaprenyl-phosphate GlcNAc-1-phosphate transferase
MKSMMMRHCAAFGLSFLVSALLLPLIIKFAIRFNIFDKPDGKIKVHKAPIPYLGGLAVYSGFIVAVGFLYPLKSDIIWFLFGVTFLLLVGLVDDLFVLTPLKKIIGQCVAVLCFFKGGFSLKAQFFSEPFNVLASGFWMLLVINAFNLVDVMDGLSSLLAMLAAGSFCCAALIFGHYTLSLLQLCFFGAVLGFFVYNRPPARVYLGDSGSLFIGGVLAASPLLFPWSHYQMDQPYIFLVPLIFLGLPLLEVFSLIVIRTALRIPFYWGSPHHFAIYLQKKRGLSVRGVLGVAAFFSLVCSIFAIWYLLGQLSFYLFFPIVVVLYLFWLVFVFYYGKKKQ